MDKELWHTLKLVNVQRILVFDVAQINSNDDVGLGNVEGDLANSGFLTTINGYNDVLQNLASQYACMYWSRTKNAAQAVVSFEFYRWMINSIFFTLASIKKTKKVEKHHHHHHHKKEKKEELCVLRHKYVWSPHSDFLQVFKIPQKQGCEGLFWGGQEHHFWQCEWRRFDSYVGYFDDDKMI